MGNTEVESSGKKSASQDQAASYRIVSFYGAALPPEFKNVIRAPFLNTLKNGNDWFKLIDRDAYYSKYSTFIDQLLLRPMALIRMALIPSIDTDPEVVLGWSLSENKTVHYVWVKDDLRRQGIGKTLLPKEFDTFSHLTHKGMSIWGSRYPEVKFDPFV